MTENMSFRTVVEIALHFESFRNVDLFHQGLYHLRTRLYRDCKQRLLAIPHSFFSCPSQVVESSKSKASRTDHHHLIPAHVIEDQCTFSTRSFLIRYCEEEVELNDVGQFRLELAFDEVGGAAGTSGINFLGGSGGDLLLEVDLMFADLTHHGGADRFGEQPDVDSTEFKAVSQQLIRIRCIEKGIHEFIPVVFDEFHFCLASLVVHSAIVDYRFRLRPLDPVLVRPQVTPSKTDGAGDGGAGAGSSSTPPPPIVQPARGEGDCSAATGPGGLGAYAQQPPSVFLSLGELLFHECGLAGRRDLLDVAEDTYLRHIGCLAESYQKQAKWLEYISSTCLTAAQREALKEALETPDLQLPEGWPAHGQLTLGASASSSGEKIASGGEFSAGEMVPSCTKGALARALRTRLTSRGEPVSESAVAALLVYDLGLVSAQVLEVWHKGLGVLLYACREVAALLRTSWEEDIAKAWRLSVLADKVHDDLVEPSNRAIGDAHNARSDEVRKTKNVPASEAVFLEDLALIPSISTRPVLFDQRYTSKASLENGNGGSESRAPVVYDDALPSAPKEYRGVHLFVLVHGFQGNSFDMRLMKNNLALLYPDAIFLCSTSNEDNTEGDFNEMGIRLAQEVVNYICDWCPGTALGRLSFIAHSIGGIIVRTALPLLHEYSSKMFTMLTFSTPHVGYFLKNISLFHMGLRVLQSWRQSTCLSQLSMNDNQKADETFLYKLSSTPGLQYFQHVVLVSCIHDQYGPFDSARIEIGNMLDQHSNHGAFAQMVRNIWKPVTPERVIRLDVNFYIPEKTLDTFIGRAAHIQFLECQPIMKMIIHSYSFLFR